MPLFSQHTARFSPDVPLEGTSSRELLKRYQPLETLATGGFGSIEICRDTHLRRRVAIKRIPLTDGAGMPASDIMDVLRGKVTDKVTQYGHDKVSTFGIGKEYAEPQLRAVMRQLLATGAAAALK